MIEFVEYILNIEILDRLTRYKDETWSKNMMSTINSQFHPC